MRSKQRGEPQQHCSKHSSSRSSPASIWLCSASSWQRRGCRRLHCRQTWTTYWQNWLATRLRSDFFTTLACGAFMALALHTRRTICFGWTFHCPTIPMQFAVDALLQLPSVPRKEGTLPLGVPYREAWYDPELGPSCPCSSHLCWPVTLLQTQTSQSVRCAKPQANSNRHNQLVGMTASSIHPCILCLTACAPAAAVR